VPVVHIRGFERRSTADVERGFVEVAEAVASAVGCPLADVWSTFTKVESMTVGDRFPSNEGEILYLELLMRSRRRGGPAALGSAASAAARAFSVEADVWARLVEPSPARCGAGAGPV
jgi:hypothetical protein